MQSVPEVTPWHATPQRHSFTAVTYSPNSGSHYMTDLRAQLQAGLGAAYTLGSP